jgi:hypothetical protein
MILQVFEPLDVNEQQIMSASLGSYRDILMSQIKLTLIRERRILGLMDTRKDNVLQLDNALGTVQTLLTKLLGLLNQYFSDLDGNKLESDFLGDLLLEERLIQKSLKERHERDKKMKDDMGFDF